MELDTAIEGIMAMRKRIHEQKQWNNPVSLSDTMTKLAVYNAYLADHIADLHHEATQLATDAFNNARKLEVGVTEAERLAKGESLNQRHKYEQVTYIYKSTGNLITVLQTRLKVIENQLKQEGVNQT